MRSLNGPATIVPIFLTALPAVAQAPPQSMNAAWKFLRVDGPEPSASGGSRFDSGNAKSLAHSPFTFFAVPDAPGTLKAVGHLGGRVIATDTVFVQASVIDRNGSVVPETALPSLAFSGTGPARLVGTDPMHVEAGAASVLFQAALQPGLIGVMVRVEGFTPVMATISSRPAEDAPSRMPGVLPALPARPAPTSFTKTIGASDGSTTTFMDAAKATTGNDCWVGLDLGGPKTTTKIRVFPRRAWTRRITGGRFQGSGTSDFHRGVKDLTALLPEPKDGQWAEITDIASARPFRYVRFSSPDDGWNNVAEIEFYTSPSPGPRSPR